MPSTTLPSQRPGWLDHAALGRQARQEGPDMAMAVTFFHRAAWPTGALALQELCLYLLTQQANPSEKDDEALRE